MHFVVMGCGRVGAKTAYSLESTGHTVSIIDQEEAAFRRLPPHFEGQRIVGRGFDKDTLQQAGIEKAYAFAAVANGDNSNILAARVARESFDVPHVVARIYDQRRAEVYQRLGIPTVATVRWTADQVLRRILPHGAVGEYRDASGRLMLAEVQVHRGWIGKPLSQIENETRCRVGYLTRVGEGILPTASTVYQEGDVLHVMMPVELADAVERILGQAPQLEEE